MIVIGPMRGMGAAEEYRESAIIMMMPSSKAKKFIEMHSVVEKNSSMKFFCFQAQ